MAKNKKIRRGTVTITRVEQPKSDSIVVQQLNIVSADRTAKDIGTFKMALESAESVHYPQRVRLYDLYAHITLDGHLTGIMGKRLSAVRNKKIIFQKGDKKVDAMDDVIRSHAFREVIDKIMETPAYGITGIDFLPGKELAFEEIPRKHIKPHKRIIALDQYDETGIAYEGVDTVWVIGERDDLGYLLKCAPYAIWKSGDMADWAQYIEIFGQPVRVVKYDAYDTKTKNDLDKILRESGSSLAMMIPKQADFEMMDGKGTANANGELQEKFKSACDNEMSVIVLGNTETTTSSQSSGYAQSKEHGKQQLEITKDDMQYVINLINSDKFLRILKSYGYPVEGGKFAFEKEVDLATLKERLSIDKEVSNKVPVSDDYWYETYGIPKPDNYEELKKEQKEQQIAMQKPAAMPPPKPATAKKQTQRAIKKAISAPSLWAQMRTIMADFFDPAP
jgi:hypothetical protein